MYINLKFDENCPYIFKSAPYPISHFYVRKIYLQFNSSFFLGIKKCHPTHRLLQVSRETKQIIRKICLTCQKNGVKILFHSKDPDQPKIKEI